MKALLIDPVRHTVTEVEHTGNYRHIYELLSDKLNELEVDTFTAVGLQNGDAIYVDDEGLLKDPRYFFEWRGYAQPLAGRGLILGTDEEGGSIEPKTTLEEARRNVRFGELSVQGFEQNTPHTVDHPVFGKAQVIGNRPVFGPPKTRKGN